MRRMENQGNAKRPSDFNNSQLEGIGHFKKEQGESEVKLMEKL